MNLEPQAASIVIDGKTQVIVLMAWPSTHIRTPGFFNALCAERGINAVMVPWAVRPEHLDAAWQGLRHIDNLAGIVLTIPHKQNAAPLCDSLEGDAGLLHVVNAVRRNADGTYTGRVYDGFGLVDGMLRRGIELAGKRVLLLGAGGAATAIALSIARHRVAQLTIANRSADKADRLATLVAHTTPGARIDSGPAKARGYDVIINATSLGMKPDDALPVDLDGMGADTVVAEVVMNPAQTSLLNEAAARGARIHHGEHMVTAQLESFVEFLLEAHR
ncbi:shikimate dehydrogenase family protein [Burkholderia anthina]|uniref:shikimate dehydrogenase (NADP(+)) n=1 Tax=Burkholderia anthina TaxID=179879 RepID=A0A6P2GB19_9BURK|nr:shikimate dehydrogenase [Burkholderia anthina]MBM2766293.1 shikimate dehydrogenase [Burkholderia anthina]VVU50466.1 shikimate 5-dehydrogenase [Burkholderia anthina]